MSLNLSLGIRLVMIMRHEIGYILFWCGYKISVSLELSRNLCCPPVQARRRPQSSSLKLSLVGLSEPTMAQFKISQHWNFSFLHPPTTRQPHPAIVRSILQDGELTLPLRVGERQDIAFEHLRESSSNEQKCQRQLESPCRMFGRCLKCKLRIRGPS